MSPLTLTLSGLDDAWADRLRADTAFIAAFPGPVRLVRGWPTEMLAKPSKDALPLVNFYVIDRLQVTRDPELVLIRSDVWDWHDMEFIDAVDKAMIDAMSGADGCIDWHDTTRDIYVSSSLEEGGDPPDKLPRRSRMWKVAPA